MATQYAATKIGYEYSIVHPSDSDIRFIGSDNTSQGVRVLRVPNNASGDVDMKLVFDNVTANQNKSYTAAFGIVNEEAFAVNITHIRVSTTGTGSDYMQIWLHGDRDALAGDDASSVFVWDKGSAASGFTDNSSTAWQLASGNQDSTNMDGASATTPWDGTAHIRYNDLYNSDAASTTNDFVWVQVSIDAPANADTGNTYTGNVVIYTEANTNT